MPAIFKTLGQAIELAGKSTEYIGQGGEYMGKGIKVMGKAAQYVGEGAKLAGDAALVAGNVVGEGVQIVGTSVKKTGQVVRFVTDKAPELGEQIDLSIQRSINAITTSTNKDESAISDLILALNAIAIATANADGEISQCELDEIEHFFNHKLVNKYDIQLEEVVNRSLKTFKKNPPDLKAAIAYIKKIKNIDWEMFENLILIVMNADDVVSKEEQVFIQKFREISTREQQLRTNKKI